MFDTRPHVVETGFLNSERVRPAELKLETPKGKTTAKSIGEIKPNAAEKGGGLQAAHPDEVADIMVQSIKDNQFWIVETTPDTRECILNLSQGILDKCPPRSLIVK